MEAALDSAVPLRRGARGTKAVRPGPENTIEVLSARPSRRDSGDWTALPITTCQSRPGNDVPVQALSSTSLLDFQQECPLCWPARVQATGPAGVVGPRTGSLLLAPGVRPVVGPPLPFVPNSSVEGLATLGHWAVPAGLACDEAALGAMCQECAQEGLCWENIFNTQAPWARRAADGPERQATYAVEGQPLPALRSWAGRLLAAIQSVPETHALELGTLGYIRTDSPEVQHLHRDLPLAEEGEAPGMTNPAALGGVWFALGVGGFLAWFTPCILPCQLCPSKCPPNFSLCRYLSPSFFPPSLSSLPPSLPLSPGNVGGGNG